ncbi:uncharacterized protein LOC110446565, partial [Mizuhopecten yessoensis]|uniref:uncharacterized protein LOC110446565 n=1 Tax=Mizuhopecten yessoensis TaxID=6573 RepID=UPI000B45D083
MTSSAWLRNIAVIVLIGCCSCKVVLITDHRNGMREKGRQKEVFSKQRQSKVWMPASLRSRADISELGLIGRGTNGQIFGTLLSDTNDGPSAPQQSIENFIDSFSTLFRPTPLQQSSIPNTGDNAVAGGDINFRQGEITSPRSGASNIVSTANTVSMARAFPGQRGFSALSTDFMNGTHVRIAGMMPSLGLSGTANTMPDTIGFDDTRSTTALLGQRDGFADDGSLFDVTQGQDVGGPVATGGNDDTFISNQGVRMTTGISLGQSRPSLRIGDDMRFSRVQDFGEMTEQRDSSSGMRGSSIDDINSLFNARIDGSTGPITGQNGDIVSEDVGVGLSTRNQDRPTQVSTLRTDDTNVGSVSASSLGNSLISNLLSRIFSTPSMNNDESLTEIGNALDSMAASESDVGGAQLLTQTANNGITDSAQITTGGQRGATVGFTKFEGANTDVLIGSKGMRAFSQKSEFQNAQDDRTKLNNQLARSQRIDDGNIGQTAKKVMLSGNQPQARKLPGKPLGKGSRLDSRKGSRMMFPSKTRLSSNTAKSRKIIGRKLKTDTVDSRDIDSTRTQFKSRGPYMVFQTSKPSNVKPGGSISSPGVPSTAFIPSSANSSLRRIRPSFSGATGRRNLVSGNQARRTASQTPPLVTASQFRTGGSGNDDRSRMLGASGSNPNFSQSGIPRNSLRQNQGNTASVSSGASSAQIGNAQSSNRRGAASISSLSGSDRRPSIPVRVFMILPNSASGSSTGPSGVTFNPSAIGKSRTKQTHRFKANLESPFALPSVSMGSTSNFGGSGLPVRGSVIPSGRSLPTSFGRGGSIRSTGSFSRRLPVGGNGRIGTNFGPNRFISGVQKGTFQGRMNTSA